LIDPQNEARWDIAVEAKAQLKSMPSASLKSLKGSACLLD